MRQLLGGFLGAAVLTMSAGAAERVGSEFPVNTQTAGLQANPDVGMDAAGNFVVVWHGANSDLGHAYARRYASNGTPLGAEFQVDTWSGSSGGNVVVAMNESQFVVAFQVSGGGIYAQRYDSATGEPLGGSIQVDSGIASGSNNPGLAMENSGDFIVTWRGYSDGAIDFRRYDAAGNPKDPDSVEVVPPYVEPAHTAPRVAIDDDGGFLIAWIESNLSVVRGRLYGADGAPLSGEVDLAQNLYRVFMDITWDTVAQEYVLVYPEVATLRARRFDTTMMPRGQKTVVSESVDAFSFPKVASLGIGGFVSCYTLYGGTPPNLFAQAFLEDSPNHTEFLVSSSAKHGQTLCDIGPGVDGCFVVVWEQSGTEDLDLFGQRFCQTGFVENHALAKVNGGSDLRLTWTNVADATSYKVYDDDQPNGSFLNVTGTALDGTVGLTVPMPPGVRYYRVAAISPSGGEGSPY